MNNLSKIEFLDKCVEQKRHIAAFHFNDVFCEYADLFHKGKSYKTTMADFKNKMKLISAKHNLKITIGRADYIDRIDFGVRNIWSIVY